MYDNKFTQKAANALQMAELAANEMGHNYIGSEHLLLGLIREGSGVAYKALQLNGVTEEKVVAQINELIGVGNTFSNGKKAFTPRTKRILELSFEEARNMSHSYIGTEHILLGMIAEGESVALKILTTLGINLENFQDEIIAMFMDGPANFSTNTEKSVPTKSQTPSLNQFGRDLTESAQSGKLDPVIGRDNEIERVIQILSRRTKNNPCLIGEPGVGKTAIVEGLAQKITEGNVPEILKGKRVVTLDLTSMVAGAKYRGEFEERIKKAIDEVKKAGNVIIFIDELHTIIGAGGAEGAIDAANILKPSLSRGELQVIGATTLNEYRKYIEKDSALERRFQPVNVAEPSVEDTISILKGLRDKYEAHHNTKITDEALKAAAVLSHRYIMDRFLPDKAIDLIDEASSKIRLKNTTAPLDLKELEDKLSAMSKEKESAIMSQDFERAAKLRDEETNLKKSLEERKEQWQSESQSSIPVVTEEDIASVVSTWTKIPVSKLNEEESQRLLKMEEIIHKRVVGQEEAVNAVSRAIRRGRAGLKDPKRPVGSFVFLGPTGVGKTELSKALAEAMFGDEDAMIRIDMSEYMEKHSVSRLVGSPPGYVGYDEGGQLTEKVRRKPYSVVLFDEIEKAHPDVFNTLLQILEDGILTDSQGRRVDFKNTVIIMTSNVGARMITENRKLGFGLDDHKENENYEHIKSDVMGELKRTFRPEFLNRIDEIIVFHQLNEAHVKEIVVKMMATLVERIKELEIGLEVDQTVYDLISAEGFDITYGARPLRRSIQTKVEDMLSEKLLTSEIKSGDNIKLIVKDNKVDIEKTV